MKSVSSLVSPASFLWNRETASEISVIAVPELVYLVSGSRVRRPASVTLFMFIVYIIMLLGTCRGLNWPFGLLMSRVSDASRSCCFLNIRHFEMTIGDNGGQRSKEAGSTPLSARASANGKSRYGVAKLLGRGSGAS
jgi:hypothetical protein